MKPRSVLALAAALAAAAGLSGRAQAQPIEPSAPLAADAAQDPTPPPLSPTSPVELAPSSAASPAMAPVDPAASPPPHPYFFGPAPSYGALSTPPSTSPSAPAPRPAPLPPKPSRQYHLGVDLGLKGIVVANAGFDPYSEGDFLPMVAIGGTWSPLRFGAVALGLAAEYDLGAQSGTARDAEASLTVHRATLGVRMEWTAARRLALQLKASPGITHVRAGIDDGSMADPLVARGTGFALDATGGAAFRIGSSGHPEQPRARFWLLAELGYSFATPVKMEFSPDVDAEDTRRFGAVRLPDLRVTGAMGRVALAITF